MGFPLPKAEVWTRGLAKQLTIQEPFPISLNGHWGIGIVQDEHPNIYIKAPSDEGLSWLVVISRPLFTSSISILIALQVMLDVCSCFCLSWLTQKPFWIWIAAILEGSFQLTHCRIAGPNHQPVIWRNHSKFGWWDNVTMKERFAYRGAVSDGLWLIWLVVLRRRLNLTSPLDAVIQQFHIAQNY